MGEILLCPYNITSRRGNRTLSILDSSHPRIQVSSVMRAYNSIPINSEENPRTHKQRPPPRVYKSIPTNTEKFFPTNNTSAGIQKYTHRHRGNPELTNNTHLRGYIKVYPRTLRTPILRTARPPPRVYKSIPTNREIFSLTNKTCLHGYIKVYPQTQRETLTNKQPRTSVGI